MDRTVLSRAAVVCVLAAVAACSQVTSTFVCQVDSDCTQEPTARWAACEEYDQLLQLRRLVVHERLSLRRPRRRRVERRAPAAARAWAWVGGGLSSCDVAEVSPGVDDTCVRRTDGSVWCFGGGSAGATQVGLAVGTIAQLANGGAGLCAVYADGTLDCAEGPATGNIGITAKQVAIGASHVCAITDGHIDCWGTNASGELGNGSTTASATPQGVLAVVEQPRCRISSPASVVTSCEVESNDGLWCWGNNARDQLAQVVNTGNVDSPVAVILDQTPASVANGDQFACVLTTANEVACWGDETKGQTGQTGDTSSAPTQVTGLSSIAQITAGGDHACARASDGRVWCWGDNAAHESAAASVAVVATPTLVVDHDNKPLMFLDVDAGTQHTCGRLAPAGELVCWGDNTPTARSATGTTTTAGYPTAATLGCTARMGEALRAGPRASGLRASGPGTEPEPNSPKHLRPEA